MADQTPGPGYSETDAPVASPGSILASPAGAPGFWRGVIDDIHINASGAVLFACVCGGIWLPSHKAEFDQTAAAAAGYLFASAKQK